MIQDRQPIASQDNFPASQCRQIHQPELIYNRPGSMLSKLASIQPRRTNVRFLSIPFLFFFILSSTISRANPSNLQSEKTNHLCLQGPIYIKLGLAKTTEAVLDFKIFFSQFNSYPDHFIRTTRNPTETFSTENESLNYTVGDVFPTWPTPLKTSISKISSLTQSDGSTTLISYNHLFSVIRWEIVTTFKKSPMFTNSDQQLLNNIIQLKIRLSQFNDETLNWETISENEIQNLGLCQSFLKK